jgi:hypothetical protein
LSRAGNIGNYDSCSFNVEGFGTYRGNEDSNPTVGKKGELKSEKEIIIGIIFEKHLEGKIKKALFDNHPYEEVAYEITTLENQHQHIGIGMVAEFDEAMDEKVFFNCFVYGSFQRV